MNKYLFLLTFYFVGISLTIGQDKYEISKKRYIVKVKTLDNRIIKGLLFSIGEKDISVLPMSVKWDYRNPENNKFFLKIVNFETIKELKIKRKGRGGRGILIGAISGVSFGMITGTLLAKNEADVSPIIITLVGSFYAGSIVGAFIGESYPHKFEIKNDSTSIQVLRKELQKYEWYHKL